MVTAGDESYVTLLEGGCVWFVVGVLIDGRGRTMGFLKSVIGKGGLRNRGFSGGSSFL